MKIGQMKIGQRLIHGAYGPRGSEPVPIVWLKAADDGRFLSELVLDRLNVNPFRQNRREHPYASSCLDAFLNSDAEVFEAPLRPDAYYYTAFGQDGRNGFLHAFSETDRAALATMRTCINGQDHYSRVRIPTMEDVFDIGARLRLFNRKGVRTQAQVYENYAAISGGYHFCPYVLTSRYTSDYYQVDSMGYRDGSYPTNEYGIRPMIRIDPCTEIEQIRDGVFQVKGGAVKTMKLPEPSGLFDFYFGLA